LEQVEEYRKALQAAGGKPVTFRLLDFGADKVPVYLAWIINSGASEERGAKLYDRIPDLLTTQLRAIVRASSIGPARVLVPMVADETDLQRIRVMLLKIQDEKNEGSPFSARLPIGAMIESVAAASKTLQIAGEADFISVGTNDLAQSLHHQNRECGGPIVLWKAPALMQLLQQIVADTHRCTKTVTICGEVAGDVCNLPALIGLGVDGVSVSNTSVAQVKMTATALNAGMCRKMTETTLQTNRTLSLSELEQCREEPAQALSSLDMLVIDAQSGTKGEVIRELANLLYANARTDDPELIEAALWDREAKGSTAFEHGFAIPHCKSDAVKHASVALLKLARPIVWSTTETEPVRVVLMLAINESRAPSQHLAVFSRLARNLMKDEFRNEVVSANSPNDLMQCLQRHLSGLPIAQSEAIFC
jgi:multiphosphoryl transfer protein